MPRHLPPVLFLTDPDRVADPVRVSLDLPARAGVIYRHFGAANRLEVGRQLAAVCAAQNLSLLIAADPDLAAELEADGVHWPEARLVEARQWRGHFQIQTASAHSRRALARAAQAGMDAALVSTVFSSNSASASRPLGVSRFHRLAQASPLPVYALGGVNAETAPQVCEVSGLAAIEGLMKPGL